MSIAAAIGILVAVIAFGFAAALLATIIGLRLYGWLTEAKATSRGSI